MVDRVLKLSLVEYMILNRSVFVLGLPQGIDYNSVQQTFLSIDGVSLVHNLRIWALSMDKTAISAHLVVRKYYYVRLKK